MSRIAARFAELKKANRAAFVPFITAGDPDRGHELRAFWKSCPPPAPI